MAKLKAGDTAYLIESNRIIREVMVLRCTGGMYLVKFTDTGGGIQVKEHRLYKTKEEAENNVPSIVEAKKKAAGPYNYGH